MAVVQISRIQLRRGKKNEGSGLPQLASGELAWCVDTQELFIGNGAVGEGAPAVGNTKLLTEKDSLLDLGTYSYKVDVGAIQTGFDVNYPVTRTLQQRLDERVTSAAYGIESNATNQHEKIQRVIDNLFLDMNYELQKSRIILEFLPGTYTFNQTVYLPSYVSIVGAGPQKTIFNYTGTGTAFEFVNDTSTKTARSTINSTTYLNQPKNAWLKGFTLNTTQPNATAIKFNAVRDSVFENLELTGPYGDSTVSITNYGIAMYALSSLVTCQRNIFDNIYLEGFAFAVFAKQDIINNRFSNNQIKDSKQGFYLGVTANGTTTGEQYGPRYTIIENSYFENIDREAIYIGRGFGNKSKSNIFVNVGNDGGGHQNNIYSIIKFSTIGNSTELDTFDRSNAFIQSQDLEQNNFSETYIREVVGKASYSKTEPRTVNLIYNTSFVNLFRIPTAESIGIEINYLIESELNNQVRRGKLTLSHDKGTNTIQIVDDYEYTGTLGEDTRIKFNASQFVVGDGIMVQYINNNSNDTTNQPTVMTYTYSSLS